MEAMVVEAECTDLGFRGVSVLEADGTQAGGMRTDGMVV